MSSPATLDYLKLILTARVYDVAQETPLELAKNLSTRLGSNILLKREDQQAVFSFKLRGAYNKMAHLSPFQLEKGVICASAGNHAQGVALSAKRLGCRAVIVMPTTTPAVKINAVKSLGGEVILAGDSYSDAYEKAVELQQKQGLTFVHPFDDPLVIAGQGTIGMEILRQQQGVLSCVFLPIGGGGLIAGIGAYIKAVRPDVKIIGVQMKDSDAMNQSVKKGEHVDLLNVGLFADGTAVKHVGDETLKIAKEVIDDFVIVDTDAVCAAIKDIFIDTRSIVEPSGAMSVAAAKAYAAKQKTKGIEGETYACVLSGANINFDRLRFVAERAEVGEEREALLAVTIPEERGSFKKFLNCIENMPGATRNVTEFNYRISDEKKADVFVGLTTHMRGESPMLASEFIKAGFQAVDLTHDDLAKEHIRYMVGGHSPLAVNERLLRFIFPERTGALMNFLSKMRAQWNISLFHYRNHGADYGRVLVGMQVPAEDKKAFDEFLSQLNFPFIEESENPAYKIFLRG